MSKKQLLRVVTFFFILFAVSSCLEDGDCLVTNSTLVKVNLKSLKTKKDTTFTFVSIKINGETAISNYANKALSGFTVPVDPGATSTFYVLTRNGDTDTLTFAYRNETIILSPECGAFDFQKDVTLTKNTLGADSAKWISRQLLSTVKSNVEIYF